MKRGSPRSPTVLRVKMAFAFADLLNKESRALEADGLLARAFQHEIDHLNGILFIDRMYAAAKVGLKRKLARLMEEWEEDA